MCFHRSLDSGRKLDPKSRWWMNGKDRDQTMSYGTEFSLSLSLSLPLYKSKTLYGEIMRKQAKQIESEGEWLRNEYWLFYQLHAFINKTTTLIIRNVANYAVSSLRRAQSPFLGDKSAVRFIIIIYHLIIALNNEWAKCVTHNWQINTNYIILKIAEAFHRWYMRLQVIGRQEHVLTPSPPLDLQVCL